MCRVKKALGPRSNGPQLKVVPTIWQEGSVELSIDQDVPASVGSGSDTVTLRAVPAPLLVTTTVNPIVSPAETLVLSAVLAMSIAAPRTPIEAEAESTPSLVVVTLAVLSTGESAAVAPNVPGELSSMHLALAPISRWPQLKVVPTIWQEGSVELSIDQDVPA